MSRYGIGCPWIVASCVLSFGAAVSAPARGEGIVADHTWVARELSQESLDRARRLEILFGHQSVGDNVLDGMSALAEEDASRFEFERATDVEPSWFDEHSGILDFYVGDNGDPMGKIDHFHRRVAEEGYGSQIAVGMMKICYVDLEEGSEPGTVFERYRDRLVELDRAFPEVAFVRWTCPLGTESNRARHEFNEAVRKDAREAGKPLFDLADIESHDRDGKPVLLSNLPALSRYYAEDEGHLNETGRKRAARALWALLAKLAEERGVR